MITSIKALKAEVDATGSFFFSPGAMRMFNSRILPHSIVNAPYSSMVYFVTSERFDDDSPRLYTVRSFDGKSVDSVSEFQQYETAREAIAAAKFVAGAL